MSAKKSNSNALINPVEQARRARLDVTKCEKDLQNKRSEAEELGLRWNSKNSRFDGYNSNAFNTEYNKLIKKLREAEGIAKAKAFDARDDATKISDFERRKEIYISCVNSCWESDEDRLENEVDFNKYCYLVKIKIGNDGQTKSCLHTEFTKPVKCTCRPGKKNPHVKVLDDELFENTTQRKCLSVIVNGVRIAINSTDDANAVRTSVRNITPMIPTALITPMKQSTMSSVGPSSNELAHNWIRDQCGPNYIELANDINKGFLPLNVEMCMFHGSNMDHLVDKINEYKTSFDAKKTASDQTPELVINVLTNSVC